MANGKMPINAAMEAFIKTASDEQFNAFLAGLQQFDPSGELHDKMQFHRQWARNPEFKQFVTDASWNALNA